MRLSIMFSLHHFTYSVRCKQFFLYVKSDINQALHTFVAKNVAHAHVYKDTGLCDSIYTSDKNNSQDLQNALFIIIKNIKYLTFDGSYNCK